MNKLNKGGLKECLRSLKQPIMGICLGMQLLFEWSAEGAVDLLGLLPARVQKFDMTDIPVPHMGWNTLEAEKENPLLKGLSRKPYVYFVHSYYAPPGDYTVARTQYGLPFSSVVNRDNIFGCQFHPERSGKDGAQILKNFLEL
jgi:glutamine amidotransferase